MNDQTPETPQASHRSAPLLGELVSQLTILGKALGIYPEGHASIQRALEPALAALETLLAESRHLTLATGSHQLLVDGAPLTSNPTRALEFSKFLSQRGLVSVTFQKGLDATELLTFFTLLHQLPPKTHLLQQPQVLDALKALPHVGVTVLDLNTLRVDDEDRIVQSEPPQGGTPLWERILAGCAVSGQGAGPLDEGGNTVLQGLREHRIPDEQFLRSYDDALKHYFPSEPTEAEALPEDPEFFRTLYAMMPELSPQLKDRILSITYENSRHLSDESALHEMLRYMTKDMAIAVARHARSQSLEISPALLKLLTALSQAHRSEEDPRDPRTDARPLESDTIEKLFERETYETYISREYSETLNALSLDLDHGPLHEGAALDRAAIQESLSNGQVDRSLTTALLRLRRAPEGPDPEGLDAYLDLLLQELLQNRDYGFLCALHQELMTEDRRTGPLDFFSGSAFVRQLAQDYEEDRVPPRELDAAILASGPANLPWILERYLSESADGTPARLQRFLCHFQNETAELAFKRLPACDEAQALALLRLIQTCGVHFDPLRVHPLLSNASPALRMEAARLCLEAKDPAPIPYLREAMGSSDLRTAVEAIETIGHYQLRALCPDLAAQLKTQWISLPQLTRNHLVLDTLGRIGDDGIIPVLERIARTRFSYTPENLKRTQEMLYRSLPGYPAASTANLVALGLRSKNETIRALCQGLLQNR